MKIKLIGFLSLFFFINFLACMNKNNLPEGLYARIDTSKGEILLNLEFKKTPLTVANFVGLAEGTKDSNKKGSHFYDGLKFHRVIADFMIQGGDPLGNGTGGPGYQFEDEFDSSLKHDKPGILSMANSGPGSNGSQFYITHVATPWLDGKHTVFGSVVEGMDVVNKIAQDDIIKSVEIIRVGKEAEAFKVTEERFQELRKNIAEREQKATTVDMKELIKKLGLKDTVTSKTGLVSSILKAGTGSTPSKGNTVTVHYTGQLTDGNVFDSSHNRNEPFQFTLGAGQVIPGWDEAVAEMKKGEERTVILPPALAYGSRGIGPIPPNSTLVFKIELLDYK